MGIYISSLNQDLLPDVHGKPRIDVTLGGRPKVTANTPRCAHAHAMPIKHNNCATSVGL